MFAGFLLSFREGLEAALIVGVLLSALQKLDRQSQQRTIWLGTVSAIILSIVVGVILDQVGAAFEGRAEAIFEGIAMLLAAGILTWVFFWMRSRARSINKKLEDDVQQAVLKDNKTALFSLAFLSVFREGVELALFLIAASMNSDDTQVIIGAVLGLLSVIVFAVLLFQSLIRLDISRFFRATSIILILFAAGLVAHGVHEFNEAGIIPGVIEHVWDINHILNENSTVGLLLKVLVGYNGNPSLTEVVAYLLFFTAIFFLMKREPAHSD
jgi:high-affinity iron transporter